MKIRWSIRDQLWFTLVIALLVGFSVLFADQRSWNNKKVEWEKRRLEWYQQEMTDKVTHIWDQWHEIIRLKTELQVMEIKYKRPQDEVKSSAIDEDGYILSKSPDGLGKEWIVPIPRKIRDVRTTP